MEYRTLPTTDIQVPKICLGSMNWGQQCSEADAHEQLDYAISQGVYFIDTAEAYPIPPDPEKQGTTERFIGTWLAKRGARDGLVIASKIAASSGIRTRPTTQKYDRENILAAIDGTLRRLQTDYVDIYQIHWPERVTNYFGVRGVESLAQGHASGLSGIDPTPIEETLDALAEVVKAGKVRYIGVSNESAWGLMEYLRLAREKGLPRVVTIQNQYSLTNRTFEVALSEICLRENVGLLPYSTLNGGVLTGKYLGGVYPPTARHTLTKRNIRYNAPAIQPAVEAYVALAHEHGLDPAQMALAFATDRAFTLANIIGATTMEQLKSDIASAEVFLSSEVLRGIDEIYQKYPDPHA